MATGLFSSASPQEMEQALLDQRAAASAALTPDQRIGALAYKAGAGATRGLGQAMGVDMQDPMIRRATMARQIAAKYPTDTAEGLMAFARDPELMASDPEMASKAMAQARTMQTQDVTTQTAQQNLRKITNTNDQEASLRAALTALGPDAPEKDILAAVTKFGTADNILKVINTSSDKAAARTAAAAALEVNNEAKMERLRVSNASAETLKQQDTSNRLLIAQVLAASRQSSLEKPLTAVQQQKQTKAAAKSTFDLRAQDDDFNSLIKEGNDIIGSKGFETVQGISGAIPSLPGSNAYKTDALITGFKSRVKKIGLDQARIGGSIGAMTEKEWPIVEQMVANISPLAGNVKDQIAAVIAKMEAMQINSRTLHADTYGEETLPKLKTRASSLSTGTPPAAAGWGKATVVK
jgi:hypothetical protein